MCKDYEDDAKKNIFWESLVAKCHINHFCYSARDKELIDEVSKEYKLIKISDFMSAELFPGHDVIFFYSRSKVVIEFLIKR